MRGLTWNVNGTPTPIAKFRYLKRFNGFKLLDFGPRFVHEDESGIADYLPPHYTGRDCAILVPQVDPNTGLTRAGIKSVAARVPTGTSLEFNYVADPSIIDLVSLSGAFIPFHKTEAARLAAGDTRPSLESLNGTQEGYVAAVRAAAEALAAERFLLQRDADRIIQQAINKPNIALTWIDFWVGWRHDRDRLHGIRSHVEPKVHHVAVGHHVVFAL